MADVSPEVDRQRVLDVTEAEMAAVSKADVAGYFSLLAADAVFMPPNTLPKEGDELRHWLRDFLERFRAEWLEYVHDEIVVLGDLAYHRYTYRWRVTPRSGGEPVLGQGKGLQILRRQSDAPWRLTRSIWNANPAAPGSR
jgi:ketosteroid isomerase-like protein